MLGDAAAARTENAERMGLVDHQPGAMAFLDVDELRQIGKIAVHAVMAFDDDQHALET